MSKNRNRAKLNKAESGREYRIILINVLYPIYWDEGWGTFPRYRPGYKNSGKKLFTFQVRQYRTWKHNRQKQYKMKKVNDAL